MNYISFVFFGLVLVVFQTMISHMIFWGKIVLEISLIVVIFAGFRFSLMKGFLCSYILGLLLDCFTGSVFGLFALIYMVFFFISRFFFHRIYAERVLFIMIFVFACSFLEGVMFTTFYKLALNVDKFHYLTDVFIAQSLLLALISPTVFTLLSKLEVSFDGRDSRSIQ